MNKRNADPVEHESTNPIDERLEQLKQLFPEAVNEDGIDVDTLVNLLGKEEKRKERYNFTWAGKQEAILSLQKRSKATLKPAPEESINWDSTRHLFIEGDNLEVMKLLYKSYFGRVKMIYIDPPYNTGNDFVYPDDYSDPLSHYLQITGQLDDDGNIQSTHADVNGKRHSRWLSMMYPRLFVARQMLRDDGVIFVSIDDNEVHNLRLVMNEIFGEENFFSQVIVRANSRGQTYKQIAKTHEYLLIYTRTPETELLELEKEGDKDDLNLIDDISPFNIRELRNRNPKFGRHNRPNLFYPIYVNPNINDKDGFHPISLEKTAEYSVEVLPKNSSNSDSCWRWQSTSAFNEINENTLISNLIGKKKNGGSFGIYEKYRKTTYKPKSVWKENKFLTETGSVELRKLDLHEQFDFPKPVGLIMRCVQLATEFDSNDIVLDFFAGSATTAQAVLEQNRDDKGNRRFIMVQLPEPVAHEQFENIAHIGEERVRRIIEKMIAEREEKLNGFEEHPDEDLGFRVFKLDESPMRQWAEMPANQTSVEEYAEQMALFVNDPLLEGWTEQDVIAEIAIKEVGFSLSYRVEHINAVTEQSVYRVIDDEKVQSFYICLDDSISLDNLEPLKLSRDELFIFRDSAVNDTIIANLALNCRIKSI